MFLDTRSEVTDPHPGQGIRRFEYKHDVQCLRELDGYGIPQEAGGKSRNEPEQYVWDYDYFEQHCGDPRRSVQRVARSSHEYEASSFHG